MRILFSLILLISFQSAFSQSTDTVATRTEEDIFVKVDEEASVDAKQWKQHLEANLQPLIEKAAKKKMKAGTYTVLVRFLVEKDGSISQVKVLNDPGYGLGKGAEKVVSNGPKWKPGKQNGKIVRSYHTQPISFVIVEG